MWDEKKPFILAFWHSQLMMIGFVWKSQSVLNMLASSHSDGSFGAYIAEHFNLKNISIESKNKSLSLRKVFKILKMVIILVLHLMDLEDLTRKVSEGIIKIAINSQVPIVPLGFASNKNFKLKSWDSYFNNISIF